MEDMLTNPLFQALFNSPVPRIIVKADAPSFTIVISNDAHKMVTNLTGKEISGKSVWEIFDPSEAGGDGGVLLSDALTQAQLENKTVLMPPFRYDMMATEGTGMVVKWWQLEIMPVGADQDSPEFLLVTTNDITTRVADDQEKENAQRLLEQLVEERSQELAAKEQKYRSLVERSPIAVALLLGPQLILDAVNSQMLRLWENAILTERKEPLNTGIGQEVSKFIKALSPQWLEGIVSVFEKANPLQFEFAYRNLSASGHPMNYAGVFLNPVFDESGVSGVIVSAIDVSEQVNARKELERMYEQLRLSKQAAQLGTFDLDLKNGLMEWDQRCRELFGIGHDEEVTYEHDFLIGLHPDDRDRIKTVIDALYRREITDGIYDVEYRTIGMQDKKLRWVKAKGKVFYNGQDVPTRFIGSVLDITDQKHEEQLRTEFISIASHELRTPLTSLLAYVQLLKRQNKEFKDVSGILVHAERQVTKMVKMINGFLNLQRLESGMISLNVSEVSMSSLIKDVISELNAVFTVGQVLFEEDADTAVPIDKDKIEHVLLNLITNAIKYSTPSTPVVIKCVQEDPWLIVSISDQGIGIQESEQERIFERYYRIEDTAGGYTSGFGIGLYLSQKIIQSHSGKIWVDSQPGHGSTFYFAIPLAHPAAR